MLPGGVGGAPFLNSARTSRYLSSSWGGERQSRGVPVWLVAAYPRGVGWEMFLAKFVQSGEDRVVRDY